MKYKAILIANWTYDEVKTGGLKGLNGPQEDLRTLKAALTDDFCGLFKPEDIVEVPDDEVAVVRDKLADFLGSATHDEALLIYFSGHAVPVRSDLVLCMRETNVNKPLAQGVQVSYINASLPASRSEHTIVILDCCYAGQSTKSVGAIDLTFAQNLYCLASSGAYETTPDSKCRGSASPFTAEFAKLLTDRHIIPDEYGAVSMDAVWAKLQTFSTKPVKGAFGRGNLVIARRGALRGDDDEKSLDPLEWLPKEPRIRSINLKVASDGILATWEGGSAQCQPVDASLREFMSGTLELIDGVGRLKDDGSVAQWREVARDFWRTLGGALMRSALPEQVRSYIGQRVEERGEDEILKIQIELLDQHYEQIPWEVLHGGPGDGERIQDFLSLTEGVLLERVCDVRRPALLASRNEGSWGLWAAHLSPQDAALSDGIISELKARAGSLRENHLLGKKCSWPKFLNAPELRFLVLTLPLRRLSDGTILVCFNSDDRPDWKTSEEVLSRLVRWNVELKGIVIETVATEPSFNAQRASFELARQISERGLGAVAYLCHPPAFGGYPLDERQVPVTFAGQLISALLRPAEFAAAVHHARSAPLRLKSSIKDTFGFPGYCWPRPSTTSGSASRLVKASNAEGVAPSVEKDLDETDQAGGGAQ